LGLSSYLLIRAARNLAPQRVPKEDIVKQGDFLNYGITLDSAEQAFNILERNDSFTDLSAVFEEQGRLTAAVKAILPDV